MKPSGGQPDPPRRRICSREFTGSGKTLCRTWKKPHFQSTREEEGRGRWGPRKIYPVSDEEKDGWANLFEYVGGEENVRLRFAVDKIGISLDGASIIFGDSRNGEAWDQFISSLRNGREEESEPDEENNVVLEPPALPPPVPESQNLLAFPISLGRFGCRDWGRGGGNLENFINPCPNRSCVR